MAKPHGIDDFLAKKPEVKTSEPVAMPDKIKSGVWLRSEDNMRLMIQAKSEHISMQRLFVRAINLYLAERGQPPIMNHNGKPP